MVEDDLPSIILCMEALITSPMTEFGRESDFNKGELFVDIVGVTVGAVANPLLSIGSSGVDKDVESLLPSSTLFL